MNVMQQNGSDMQKKFSFRRSDFILSHKFYQYLLPSILNIAATSLNEFLDSIVVAQTLGSGAMAMVNMASPVMLIFSTVYVLLGVGGSTVYATLKGQMKKETAASVLSVTMLFSAAVSLIILAAGIIFCKPLAAFFSGKIPLTDIFTDYLFVLFLSSPFIILLQTLLMFFPAEGMPKITTILNIIANVVNIICDYVYIKVFNMNLAGAAYATLTGYITAILVISCLWVLKKYRIPFGKISRAVLSYITEAAGKGLASAVGQFGFFIKISFSNYMAILLAGAAGIAVFSACFQTVSVISIFIGGVLDAMIPIVAILYGQKDYNGIRLLMKRIVKMELILSVVLFLAFEAFPKIILSVYKVTAPEELSFGIPALRIFSFMYLFRQTVIMFIYYFQTIDRKFYAVALSLTDGFIGIILLTLIFYKPLGVDGLMLSYPLCSFLMLIGIMIINRFLIRRSKGTLRDDFLLPEAETKLTLDFTLTSDSTDISRHIENLQKYLFENGIDRNKATIMTVACEEICSYIRENADVQIRIDVLLQVYGEEVHMNFRSVGMAFSPMSLSNPERFSNIDVLKKISKEVRYDYVLGMNQTQVII